MQLLDHRDWVPPFSADKILKYYNGWRIFACTVDANLRDIIVAPEILCSAEAS